MQVRANHPRHTTRRTQQHDVDVDAETKKQRLTDDERCDGSRNETGMHVATDDDGATRDDVQTCWK